MGIVNKDMKALPCFVKEKTLKPNVNSHSHLKHFKRAGLECFYFKRRSHITRQQTINQLKQILGREDVLNAYYNVLDWLKFNKTPLKLITKIKCKGKDDFGYYPLQISLIDYYGNDFGSVEYSVL